MCTRRVRNSRFGHGSTRTIIGHVNRYGDNSRCPVYACQYARRSPLVRPSRFSRCANARFPPLNRRRRRRRRVAVTRGRIGRSFDARDDVTINAPRRQSSSGGDLSRLRADNDRITAGVYRPPPIYRPGINRVCTPCGVQAVARGCVSGA